MYVVNREKTMMVHLEQSVEIVEFDNGNVALCFTANDLKRTTKCFNYSKEEKELCKEDFICISNSLVLGRAVCKL